MADQQFDPYHKWLGIRASEQPATAYRLLGLTLFEDDADVIEAAADQRMAHVRTYQLGRHAALSQQLLNELADAKVRLLDPAAKARYDGELRAAQSNLPARQATSPPTVPAAIKPPPLAPIPLTQIIDAVEATTDAPESPSVAARYRRSRAAGARRWIAVGCAATAIVGAAVWGWQAQGEGEHPTERQPEMLAAQGTTAGDPPGARAGADGNAASSPVAAGSDRNSAGQPKIQPMLADLKGKDAGLPGEQAGAAKRKASSAGPDMSPVAGNERDAGESRTEMPGADGEPPPTNSQSAASETKRWSLRDLLGDQANGESESTPPDDSVEQPQPGKSGPPRPRLAPKDAILVNDRWYWFSLTRATPQEAQLVAAKAKGRLLVISSDEENAYITSRLKGPTFLGMAKIKGVWVTGEGKRQEYFNWDRGQPSSASGERFAAIHPDGRWHDYRSDTLYFCIEWGKER